MPPTARPAINQSVDAFRRILRSLRVAARRTQTAVGISAAQLFVLHMVAEGDECSLSELATRTMTDRTSVAAVVERLIERGLVSREGSRVDRRRAAISITRKGRALLARAPEPPAALLVAGLETLSTRRLSVLARSLEALVAAMALDDQPAGLMFDDGDDTRSTSVRAARQSRKTKLV